MLLPAQAALAPQRARILRDLGQLCHDMGDLAGARPHLEASLALAQQIEDEYLIALAASSLASLLCNTGELALAEAYMLQSLAYDEKRGDPTDLAITYGMLGEVAMYQERWAEGEQRLRHALRLQEALGDRYSLMITHLNLGHALLEQSRFDEALPFAQAGLAYAHSLAHRFGEATALKNLADVLLALEEEERAFTIAIEAFDLCQTHNLYQTLGTLLEMVGTQVLKEGELETGVQLLGSVKAAERAGQVALQARHHQAIAHLLDELRQVHGAGRVDRLCKLGERLPLAEAVQTALHFCRERAGEGEATA